MSKPIFIEINQAKIALYPIKEVRSVVINIMIKAGSWYEKGGNWGAFHLLEHMMFQGNKKLKNHEEIEVFKQENGISDNGGTCGRNTSYQFKFPNISINQGFDFFENFIFNPSFPKNEFAKEISVIEQEYNNKWDNPSAIFDKVLFKNLFGENHIFQRDGLGQPEFIKTIKKSSLKALHQKYYQPQNMIISVVGNFDKDEVEKKLKIILNKYSNSSVNQPEWPLVEPQKHNINYQDKVNQSYLVIDWFLNKNKTFDLQTKIGLNILNYILGGGPNSILFKKIRQELGLVYSIKSNSFDYPKTNLFEIWATVDNKNLNILIENIKNALTNFLNKPIDKDLFERTRHFMDLQTLMGFDSIYNISNNLVEDIYYYNKIYSAEDKIKIAQSINPEEIKSIFRENLKWEDAYVSIMTQSKPE